MKRVFLPFILSFVLFVGMSSCKFAKPSQSGVVAILSVNDMHAAIDHMPQFAAIADSLRQIYPDLLVFSAGDNRTGNPINDQYQPTNYPMIALMNKVGFDLCAVGNHEWDAGQEAFQRNIEDANFPFLCANIILPQTTKLNIKPYEILEVQGLKIGVVGMLEVRATGLPGAHPKNFEGISFEQPYDALQNYLHLRNQCNVFILLSHVGFEDDLEIAERYPMLDAIIGGHTHTLIEHPTKHNGVVITQAGSSLSNATLTLIKVEQGKVANVDAVTLDVQHEKKKNAEVKKMVDDFNNDQRYSQPLSTAITPFETREELGCMLTDAIRDKSDADFAFNNTGGIRLNRLKKGPITVKEVYEIDPFTNDIVVFAMKGKQIERFIMESYKKNGRTPSYVSGMSYEVLTSTDGYPKSVNITLDKGRYSPEATYKVAMNSYMASTVRFESVDDGTNTYMTSEEMLIEYLKEHPTVSYRGVTRVK